MKIEHISVSRLQLFEQCHAAYRFKYHMKLPSCEPEPFYFVYGKIVHKVAEEYVKNKAKIPIGRVALDILEGRTPLETRGDKHTFAPKLPPEYSKRLPEHINSVGKITKQMGVDGDVEYEFFYDLDEPHKRYAKGFIDRVIPKGNKIVILDYKTSKPGMFRKNKGNISKDLQLQTYARVVQKKYNVPAKNILCALCYLEDYTLMGAQFTDETLLKAEENLLDSFKEIENTTEEQAWGNVGNHCKRCDYCKICPFYRLT